MFMTTLHPILLPPNLFHIFSEPKFKFRTTTVKNHVSGNLLLSNNQCPQTHFVSNPQPARRISFCFEPPKTGDFEYLSLLLNRNDLCDCRQIHAQVLKLNALKSNWFVGNKLAILYMKRNGLLDVARKVFDETPEKSVPTYAALIGSYCRLERWSDLFFLLEMMIGEGMLPDKYLVPTILKACSAKQFLGSGKMVHGYVLRKDLGFDIFVGNALINLYANCLELEYSRRVFDRMKERDVVSWTALVSAYMDEGLIDEAVDIFNMMRLNGVEPDLISWNALVSGFAQNGEITLALESLTEMEEKGLNPKVNTWNGIISGFVQNGYYEEAMDVFNRMIQFLVNPNVVTVVSILPACAGLESLNMGKTVHGYAIKHGLCTHAYVEGSLIDMYSKCGKTEYAEKVFGNVVVKNTAMWNEVIAAYVHEGKIEDALGFVSEMRNVGLKPDVITYNTLLTWYGREGQKNEAFRLLYEMTQMNIKPNIISFNVLVSGFQQSGLSFEALKLFKTMLSPSSSGNSLLIESPIRPNSITTNGALAACSDLKLLGKGKEIHGYIVRNLMESNIYLSCALVDMYGNCHDMDSAFKVFSRVVDRSVVLWNTLMTGYINNDQPEEAIKLFNGMLVEYIQPSFVTFMVLLSACSDVVALNIGKKLHTIILKSPFDDANDVLACALIDMYAKCGTIIDAKLVFDTEAKKDTAIWNAMISAYSVHGQSTKALDLFKQMEILGITPDHITFVGILSACARDGLVENGWEYFNSMETVYGIPPRLEHYTCVVAILGGAGLLNEALDFITRMPYPPDACVWVTLLQACRTHSNAEVGEKAANALFLLEPKNASNYILLSNIYVSSGMWDSAKNLRSLMKDRGLMTQIKECSLINVGTNIYSFRGGKGCFSDLDEVLRIWDNLAIEMENVGYFPQDPVFEEEQELDPFSCSHTEKLAISFGIISSKSGQPIRVSKNIRMCIDCHTSAKLISKIDGRVIFVKDTCFYHHFQNGICSCQDRW